MANPGATDHTDNPANRQHSRKLGRDHYVDPGRTRQLRFFTETILFCLQRKHDVRVHTGNNSHEVMIVKKIIEYNQATGVITAAHTGPDDMSISIAVPGVAVLVVPGSTPHVGMRVEGGHLVEQEPGSPDE